MVQKDANGIGKKFSPLIYPAPHCSKANSYVFQGWTIQMRQAKSYLAFRCEIPKYIIHVILFAKGCISSTHYSCSYRSIISCCKWYRKYAYCYISRQTCRISPLWLCSYCNVSPTQNVVWSYTRYSSQCCIGAIAIPSTSSWTTTKQQCWTNKNVEYQWENGFIVWDYSPLFTAL